MPDFFFSYCIYHFFLLKRKPKQVKTPAKNSYLFLYYLELQIKHWIKKTAIKLKKEMGSGNLLFFLPPAARGLFSRKPPREPSGLPTKAFD
jgi:hypothetical protein